MKVREFTKEESPYIASSISQEIWQSAANYGYAEACKDHQELVDALEALLYLAKCDKREEWDEIKHLKAVLAKYKGE